MEIRHGQGKKKEEDLRNKKEEDEKRIIYNLETSN